MSTSAVRVRRRHVGQRVTAEPGRTRLDASVVFVLAALVGNVLSANSQYVGLPLSPDRLLFPAALTLLCLERGRAGLVRLRWRWVHGFMTAFLAWTLWSASSVGSLTTASGLFALLDRVMMPFLLFCTAPLFFEGPRARTALLRVLVVLGLYLGITAYLEVVGPVSLVFPQYIVDPALGIQFGRARGPFLYSEADGLVLIVSGFAAGVLAVYSRGFWRVVGLLAVVTCSMGALLTLTRSVWAGAILGLLAVAVTTPSLRRWLLPGGLALAVLVWGVLLALPAVQASVTERAETARSLHDRQNTNTAAFRIVEQEPLTGVGWTRFIEVSKDYVRQSDEYPITTITIEVHNVVLGRAAELGIPGAALWVACIAAGPGLALVRRRQAGEEGAHLHPVLLGAFMAWGLTAMVSPLSYPLPNYLVWLLAGAVAAPWLLERPRLNTARS